MSSVESFIEDENQIENEDDIDALHDGIFSTAVVSGNDWTTETLISQINKGNILLNPDFQRRDAWDKKRKSKFIESLFLGLPIPQVVLAESKKARGEYIVLDGKQRLLSIRQFSSLPGDSQYESLKLNGLEVRQDLNGKTLEDLKSDLTYYEDLSSFENQPIRTVVIKNWPNESFLYHVFLRLNTGSVPLSPHELRQALHPGPFTKFLDEKALGSEALKEILKSNKPDFRMRDAELLLRYFSFENRMEDYTGTLKTFLDQTCELFNNEWEHSYHTLRDQLEEFEAAHTRIKEVFEGNQYRKWTESGYEKRFNRAIFDILIHTFNKPQVRAASAGMESEIQEAFRQLCMDNTNFLSSIQSTTKSLQSTYTRFSEWTAALNSTLQLNLHVPTFRDGRIV